MHKIRLFHLFVLETDEKILQFNWLRTFWPISQEQKFSQIWDLCRNTANFWSIFAIFGVTNFFLENLAYHTQLHMGL